MQKISKREINKKIKQIKKEIDPILTSDTAKLRVACVELYNEVVFDLKLKGEFFKKYFNEDFNEKLFNEFKKIMEGLGYKVSIRDEIKEEDCKSYNSYGSFNYTKTNYEHTVIINNKFLKIL